MAAFARRHGVRLRPHAKMHKSATIARLQIEAGAVGVCVQKTSEAEALASAGIADIYISNEVIDPAKLARVAALAARIRLAIAVDSVEGIDRLAARRRRRRQHDRRLRRGRRRPRPLRCPGGGCRPARPARRRPRAARRRPALRRRAGVPRRGAAPARRRRARSGVAARRVARARGAGEHRRRRHRLPARHRRRHRHVRVRRRERRLGRAAGRKLSLHGPRLRRQRRVARARRASSTRSSSRAG